MIPQDEQQQRDEFCNILLDLATSQELLQDQDQLNNMYNRLEDLYHAPKGQDRFRHFYSDILSVLMQIEQTPTLGSIDILGQNLDVIRENYREKNLDENGDLINISDALKKLYDHVNLEMTRMILSDAGDRDILGEKDIENIHARISSINTSIEEINHVQEKAERKLQNQQKEYITILGIFASIVIAFMSGISFSSSVLDNILGANIFKLILVLCLLGMVLLNAIYLLTKFIFIINEKDPLQLKPKGLNIAFSVISIIALVCYLCTS